MKNPFLQNLFLISLFLCTQIIQAGPYCWDYQEKRWLRQGPFTPVNNCPCNCAQQYQTTDFDKRGRKCSKCDHKQVISSDSVKKKNRKISAKKTASAQN